MHVLMIHDDEYSFSSKRNTSPIYNSYFTIIEYKTNQNQVEDLKRFDSWESTWKVLFNLSDKLSKIDVKAAEKEKDCWFCWLIQTPNDNIIANKKLWSSEPSITKSSWPFIYQLQMENFPTDRVLKPFSLPRSIC